MIEPEAPRLSASADALPQGERRLGERRLQAVPVARERRQGERRQLWEVQMQMRRRLAVRREDVLASRLLLVLVVSTVIAADLVHKAIAHTRPEAFHVRSAREVAVMVAISLLGTFAFPRAGSRLIAAAGGLMVGGGLANVLSVGLFGRGVPNPFVVQAGHTMIAFNLADICVATGFALLLPSVLGFAVAHRAELERPLDELR
ncbi:MAG: signal peptidase II [Gaiellaceae bacterium]